MPKETIGYVRMIWVCPNCKTQNPGPYKFCTGCGAAQPTDVKFERATQEDLIKDEKEISAAKAGADIHCGFCGTRNPAGAKICSQCGGDLTGAKIRESGQLIGAAQTGQAEKIKCPACGNMNPPSALQCTTCGSSLAGAGKKPAQETDAGKPNWLLFGIGGGALLVVICLLIYFLFIRTTSASGVVESVFWSRNQAIQEIRDVKKEDWKDNIPGSAVVGMCTQKYRTTQNEPAPVATKVCGTPYMVDKGNGYAEQVQDCGYEVYDDYCEFTVKDWTVVKTVVASGKDTNPVNPSIQLGAGQRQGGMEEIYECHFDVNGEKKVYKTNDVSEFMKCQIGSQWTLKINTMGAVVSIEPVK